MMDFTVSGEEHYAFIARTTAKHFCYGLLKRTDKAIVLRFLERVSEDLQQGMATSASRRGLWSRGLRLFVAMTVQLRRPIVMNCGEITQVAR